jgi:hypothetical protein
MSDPRLLRRKCDPQMVAAEKHLLLGEQWQRDADEGKLGHGKRRHRMGWIRGKLAIRQGSSIAINVLVMNLQKRQKLLLILIGYWVHLLLIDGDVLKPRDCT